MKKTVHQTTQKRKAYSLHIGINQVNPTHYSGWDGKLSCCENDAGFYSSLALRLGVSVSKLLLSSTNSNDIPSSENVRSFLDRACTELRSGDVLFISYSGHGGFIPDQNGDEGADGQDETWCLYDRQLLDDELIDYFSRFTAGVRILVISDSCHSGSVCRSSEAAVPVAGQQSLISRFPGMVFRKAPRNYIYRTYKENSMVYTPFASRPKRERTNIAATVLQLGACQDNQEAGELDGYGLFTSRLKYIVESGSTMPTYEQLIEQLRTQLPEDQTPSIDIYGSEAESFKKQIAFQFNIDVA